MTVSEMHLLCFLECIYLQCLTNDNSIYLQPGDMTQQCTGVMQENTLAFNQQANGGAPWAKMI